MRFFLLCLLFIYPLHAFDEATQANIDAWLYGHYDETSKAEIRRLIDEDPVALVDAFYQHLSFGTGGLRGIMGVGSNRMNLYNVGASVQGLAHYLNKIEGSHTVLIGYDSRQNSKIFAEEAAKILAANNIKVLLFSELRPVPLVSFGCRHKQCSAAIMITASHNPAKYNGLKIFWKDGCQVLPPHETEIIEEIHLITDPMQVHKVALPHPLVKNIQEEIDEAYLATVRPLQNFPEDNKKAGASLHIVYTSLHGAGITLVPKTLADWGFTHITYVDKQVIPDGDFPTCSYPNPEEPAALELGIQTLQETKADLLLATDPDTDRLGVVVRHHGEAITLNGNEVGCLCLHYLCKTRALPANAAFIKTIVTSELFQAIVTSYHKHCENVLTGFKYIGEKMEEWTNDPRGPQFVFAGEESCGYLYGTHARDKDGVISAALISEIALQCKKQGRTLVDLLEEIYFTYGIYKDKLISLTFSGKAGADHMSATMKRLREDPPTSFAGVRIIAIEDFETSLKTSFPSHTQEPLTLPKSNVLVFWMEDGSRLVIRPSGTEPKIKLYCSASLKKFDSLNAGMAECDAHVDEYLEALKQSLQ